MTSFIIDGQIYDENFAVAIQWDAKWPCVSIYFVRSDLQFLSFSFFQLISYYLRKVKLIDSYN
jgi:hypothetical protein